jgi:hypothetical protein
MKFIKDYEELYSINEDGRIYSHISKIFLNPYKDSHGYFVVTLTKDKTPKWCKVHRLIAEAYIPNPENKPFVDHINRIKTDNSVDNLRWVTITENNQNQSVYKTNKLKEQYICYDTKLNYYVFSITRNNVKHQKRFKTKDEAISYRNEYLV